VEEWLGQLLTLSLACPRHKYFLRLCQVGDSSAILSSRRKDVIS
jgi:hypothetical protein